MDAMEMEGGSEREREREREWNELQCERERERESFALNALLVVYMWHHVRNYSFG
jgi:hypothetical protein